MEKSYRVIIDGVDYSKYLSLPFFINLRADEAYNNGSVTLIRLNRKEEFEPYTNVRIEVSNSQVSNVYHMIVEEDSVEEVYNLTKPHYNHKLVLIEKTKILDGIYIPDFTITNPATVTSIENFVGSTDTWSQINSDYGGSGIKDKEENEDMETASESELMDGYTTIRGSHWHKGGQAFWSSGQYWSFIYDGWRSYYDVPRNTYDTTIFNGSYFDVPTPTTSTNPYACTCRLRIDYNAIWMGYGYGRDRAGTNISRNQITGYYYYDYSTYGNISAGYNSRKIIVGYTIGDQNGNIWSSKALDSSRFRVSGGKVQIKPPDNTISNIGCFVVKPGPWYDSIYNSIYGSTPSYDRLWNLYYNVCLDQLEPDEGGTPKSEGGNGKFKLKTIAKMCVLNDGGDEPTSANEFATRMANYAMNTQYNWSNSAYSGPNNLYWDAEFTLKVVTVQKESNPNIISAKSPYTTVQEVLDKVIEMIDPAYGKFTAKNIPAVFGNAEVSERAYQGNNLAEILFDLGKIIRAYPELDSNNNITFNELTPLDNPLFNDSTEGTSYSKNTDNAVTRYVSDIENVVSTPNRFTDIYSYWPSRTNFARPNGAPDSYSATPDTSTITIPSSDGIYFLKKLEVTNCIKPGGVELEDGTFLDYSNAFDITPFCYEKNYYDSLAVNSYGGEGTSVANFSKDNCIWWEQKTNQIHLEELEQQTKIALFGDNASETYRIQNTIVAAIKAKYGDDKFDKKDLNQNPNDYHYRVTYVEYNSARTITEKFNDDKTQEISDNYNQQANTISGVDWSSLAQTDLLRRGSRDLSKTINIYRVDQLPSVGESLNSSKGTYFADNLNLEFNNNYICCNLNYTKDYNKILPSVAISKEYRQYEIYGGASVDRYVNINRYHYIDSIYDIDINTNSGDYNSKIDFCSQLSINDRDKVPSIAVVLFKDKNKNLIRYKAMDASGNLVDRTSHPIVIPVVYTSSGNSISFTAKLYDNFSGGAYPNLDLSIPYKPIVGDMKDSGAWVLEEARYVDDLGEAAYASFYLIDPSYDPSLYSDDSYPYINISEGSLRSYSLEYEENIRIDKDNRERICFNFQIHFLTETNNIKWHPALLKYLMYDNADANEMFKKDGSLNISEMGAKYYAYTYRLQDERFAPVTNAKSSSVSIESSTYNSSIKSSFIRNITNPENIKSIALVWPKTNEILFHIDVDYKSNETVTIPQIVVRRYKNKK